MQEVIDASTRMRHEAEGGGLCEGHHVVGTALQGLACMSMDNNLIGMRALLMHETTSKRIDNEKGNDATGNKKIKDPKKKERWSKAEKQEAAKTNSITCFKISNVALIVQQRKPNYYKRRGLPHDRHSLSLFSLFAFQFLDGFP